MLSTMQVSISFINIVLLMAAFQMVHCQRSFIIDYENNQFLKDGKPFRYISGSMHYYRVPSEHWEDRLLKMKAAGLNTVDTYVDWGQHEPEPDIYKFDGMMNIKAYLELVQSLDLFIIIRPGPYVCGETELGGLPYWLQRDEPQMILRSSDPAYLKYVDKWMTIILGLIKSYLYENGGPIIAVQIENDYGWTSYVNAGCDNIYKTHLKELFRRNLGYEVVLFTSDIALERHMKCGKFEDIFAALIYNPFFSMEDAVDVLRRHQPNGPLVISEFHLGWFDRWGYPHAEGYTKNMSSALHHALSSNASINMYMFHGGTNFGFTIGSHSFSNQEYHSMITSYDFGSPLSEAGDPTMLYYNIRDILNEFVDLSGTKVPPAIPKHAYGRIQMQLIGSLFDLLTVLSPTEPIQSQFPLTFEQLRQAYGFVLYETLVKERYMDPVLLDVHVLHDRGYVFLDQDFIGILSRAGNVTSLPISVLPSQTLSILVENQGRLVLAGYERNDFKGILANVTLDGFALETWNMTTLPFNDTLILNELHHLVLNYTTLQSTMTSVRSFSLRGAPAIYVGEFVIDDKLAQPEDSFLYFDGWHKGIAFVNGFNLGRYWPRVGPQVSLYVPKSVFLPYPQVNTILVFELEKSPCFPEAPSMNNVDVGICYVEFKDSHFINSTTPLSNSKFRTEYDIYSIIQKNSIIDSVFYNGL